MTQIFTDMELNLCKCPVGKSVNSADNSIMRIFWICRLKIPFNFADAWLAFYFILGNLCVWKLQPKKW